MTRTAHSSNVLDVYLTETSFASFFFRTHYMYVSKKKIQLTDSREIAVQCQFAATPSHFPVSRYVFYNRNIYFKSVL